MNFLKKLYAVLFVWDFPIASEAETKSADAVVTMALIPLSWPGSASSSGNRIMAKVAREIYEKYGKPLLISEEVAYADPEIKYVHISEDPIGVGESSVVWNTHAIAKLQKEFCDKNGWKRVIVIASPDHMLRACWTYQKLGLKTLSAPMPKSRKSYRYPGSFQYSVIGFRIREMICRFLFWRWGYI